MLVSLFFIAVAFADAPSAADLEKCPKIASIGEVVPFQWIESEVEDQVIPSDWTERKIELQEFVLTVRAPKNLKFKIRKRNDGPKRSLTEMNFFSGSMCKNFGYGEVEPINFCHSIYFRVNKDDSRVAYVGEDYAGERRGAWFSSKYIDTNGYKGHFDVEYRNKYCGYNLSLTKQLKEDFRVEVDASTYFESSENKNWKKSKNREYAGLIRKILSTLKVEEKR